MRHAASGANGAFHFIVFHDQMELGKPTMRMESPLKSANSGSDSQWTFNSDQETIFIGLRIPNDNTDIPLHLTAPTGFRGLDPHWFTGPANATGSQLQPGSPGDVSVALTPGQSDSGARFPGLRIEPTTTGAAGLKDYYHLDFATADASDITEPGLCIEILLQWIRKISPGGIMPFLDRAAWDAAHPDAGDRGYLDYLIDRFTQQPLNRHDLDTLADRLSAFYRINFHAPESSRASRLQFLINILQEDLHGRNVFFHSYQAWLNLQNKKQFPENFYTHRVPLIEPKQVPASALSQTREQLPSHHSTQVVMECLQHLYGIDEILFDARKEMILGEYVRAEHRLREAEASLAFLLKHNYFLQSKLTTSQHLQQLIGEKEGTLFSPSVRIQLRDRVLLMVHPDVGDSLVNIRELLFPGTAAVAPVPGMQESGMYTQRRGRPKTQVDTLMKDVRQPFPATFDPLFNEVIRKSGNLGSLAPAQKNTFRQNVRNLWLTVPHYLFFTLPLDYAECCHQLGDYGRAERYLQLVIDHEHLFLEEQIVYRYLNLAIEVPHVSLMAGRNYAVWADRLMHRGGHENQVRARNLFRQARDLLRERVDADNPAAQQWVAFCETGLLKLNKNLNALGYPNDFVPVFRYIYLVGLADEMTRQAIDAGRQTVAFMQQAEAALRGELEAGQAVVLNETLVAVERLRVSEAEVQAEIAGLQRWQVDQEIENLDAKIEELSDPVFAHAAFATGLQSGLGLAVTGAAVGGPVGALIGVIVASESGPGAVVGGAIGGVAGIALGGIGGVFLGYAQGMAQWKAHESQIHDQKRAKTLLESFGRSIADRQVDLAEVGRQIAQANLAVAGLRTEQARELSALIGSQAFNADQLYDLARQMREIYRTYLRYANEMAFLAEQSLEFELNERLDFIRFDYYEPAQAGLLGAERLQIDIETLKKAKVNLYDEKRLPVTVSVSLREEFPLAFFELIQNGKAGFQTSFELFNRLYPGAYQSRISRVELVFYALVPQEGLHGTLSSTGISYVQDEFGEIKAIATAPEKSIISKYRIADGQIFFFDPREHYHPFEGMGVVTDWTIDLPKSSNAIDYTTIFDVHLVLHYTTLSNDALAQQVVGQLSPVLRSARSFSLHHNFADGFYHIANEGKGTFALQPGHFPADHTNGTIRSVMILHALRENSTVGKVITTLNYRAADGQSKQVSLTLDRADPAAANTGAEPFMGLALYGEWEISVRMEDGAGSVLPDLGALKDLIFLIEYEYERRSARYRVAFESNPLTVVREVNPPLSWSLERRGEANTVNVTAAPDGSVELEIRNNGAADEWIDGPVVRSPLDPVLVTPDTIVQWTQFDLAHALYFELTLAAADGRQYPLTYSANASNHWRRKGWVNMSQTAGVPTALQTFRRRLFGDFLTEYGVPPQRVTGIRAGHFSNRKTTTNHGGGLLGVAFQEQRLLPVKSDWAWSGNSAVLKKGSGGRFLVGDAGTPGHYTLACRARAQEPNSRVDLWFGGGIYQVSVVPGSSQSVLLNVYEAPYAGAIRKQLKGPKSPVKSGQWFWFWVAKWGNRIAVEIDGTTVVEFTDTVDASSSEIAVGSNRNAVEIDRVLSS